MSNCDDTFQEIQKLNSEIEKLDSSRTFLKKLSSIENRKPNTFKVRGVDGNQLEIDYDQWWYRMANDPEGVDAWAERAVGQRSKPAGAEGMFENIDQLVRNLGEVNAQEMLSMLQRQTGDWQFYNERDFNLYTRKTPDHKLKALLEEGFKEAGVTLEKGSLDAAIAQEVGPFLGILNNQTKLQIYADHMLKVLRSRIIEIANEIRSKGSVPRSTKQDLLKTWASAIFAHRSRSIAKRRWGQMGLNLQFLGKQNPAEIDSVYRTTGRAAVEEAEQMAEEVLTATTDDFVKEGSLITKVIEAIDKGPKGLDELDEIQRAIRLDGVDPNMPLENGWESAWKRTRNAAWKDNIFFAISSQLRSNWLSQKIVYAVEGMKSFYGTTMELTDWPFKKYTQRNLDLPEIAIQGDLFKPYGTEATRNYFKAMWDSGRMHIKSHFAAESQMRSVFTEFPEIMDQHFFKGDTPFAGAVDKINNPRGMMTVDEQYKTAEKTLNEPMEWFSVDYLPMQIRNKVSWAYKVFANRLIEKETGVRFPVLSALQMFAAVDHRAGKRAFLSQRHMDMSLQAAKANPHLGPKEWAEIASEQLEDQLYQATPSKQNISDYRKQYKLGDEISDDEIEAVITLDKVGAPVLAEPGQVKAYEKSFAMRMQNKLEGPVVFGKDLGTGQFVDEIMGRIRSTDYGDALVPVWRSASAQTMYDIALGNPAFLAGKLVNAIYHGAQGKLTTKMMVDVHSHALTFASLAALWYTLSDSGNIVGNGPPPGTPAARNWRERLRNEGKVPNSVLGIPWNMGGVPLLNTLFLYEDLIQYMKDGHANKYDKQTIHEALLVVGTGHLMRMPGFKQFQMISEAIADQSPSKMKRAFSFLAMAQAPVIGLGAGVGRTLEGMTGTSRSDLYAPTGNKTSMTKKLEEQVWDPQDKDHPVSKLENWLRTLVYDASPLIAAATGAPKKEFTWLGRDVIRPDNHAGEWLIGQPGLWGKEGTYKVEKVLDQLGLLEVPEEITNQRVGDIPITVDLVKDLNYEIGHIKGDKDFAYSGDPVAKLSGKDKYGFEVKLLSFTGKRLDGLEIINESETIDILGLLNAAVAGRTVREAMNYVIESPTWQKLETNEEGRFSINNRDLTREEIRNLPGPKILKILKEFYTDKAKNKVLSSEHDHAKSYRERLKAMVESQSIDQMQKDLAIAESAFY